MERFRIGLLLYALMGFEEQKRAKGENFHVKMEFYLNKFR